MGQVPITNCVGRTGRDARNNVCGNMGRRPLALPPPLERVPGVPTSNCKRDQRVLQVESSIPRLLCSIVSLRETERAESFFFGCLGGY